MSDGISGYTQPEVTGPRNFSKTGFTKIANQDILCGSVTINTPRFDIFDPRNANYVLVQVNAFSCNYRDKALIIRAAEKMEMQEDARPFAFFGSDFVGTVKAVGSNVSDLRAGMRVIPDCAYPYAPRMMSLQVS